MRPSENEKMYIFELFTIYLIRLYLEPTELLFHNGWLVHGDKMSSGRLYVRKKYRCKNDRTNIFSIDTFELHLRYMLTRSGWKKRERVFRLRSWFMFIADWMLKWCCSPIIFAQITANEQEEKMAARNGKSGLLEKVRFWHCVIIYAWVTKVF